MFNCNYCYKKYASRNSLSKHQKVSYACLVIQSKTNPDVKFDKFHCNDCSKNFTSKDNLTYHINICNKQKTQNIDPNFVHEFVHEVELDIKKSTSELNKILKHKLSVDIRPYLNKDVLYFYGYEPTESSKSVLIDGKNYYEFGVSSNIEQRDKTHRADKNKCKPRLDKCIVYKSRSDLSRGEKFLKNILVDMNLKIDYLNSNECFIATDEELAVVYERMYQHSLYVNAEQHSPEYILSLKKLDLIEKLLANDKLSVDTVEQLLLALK